MGKGIRAHAGDFNIDDAHVVVSRCSTNECIAGNGARMRDCVSASRSHDRLVIHDTDDRSRMPRIDSQKNGKGFFTRWVLLAS